MIFCVAGKVSFSMWASPFASLSRAQKIKRFTEADQLPATVNKIEKKRKRKQHVDRPVEPVHGPAEPSMGCCCQIHLPAAESGLVGPGSTVLHRIKLRVASHLTRRDTTGGATPPCRSTRRQRVRAPHAAPSPLRVATEGERGVRELGSGSRWERSEGGQGVREGPAAVESLKP